MSEPRGPPPPHTIPAFALAARAALEQGRARIFSRHREGRGGQEIVRAISALTDEVVQSLLAALCDEEPPEEEGAPRGPPPIALVALGGYGRCELSPRSDVDLLVLLPEGKPDSPVLRRANALAEKLHRALWDSGLEAGFGARTLAQSLALSRDDHTARTALLDCRLVAGDAQLFSQLERAAVVDLAAKRVEEFIADKLEELQARRARYGGSVWLLEPHLKQGKGGLRDLHTALWIARARHKVAGLGEAGDRRLLPAREVEAARTARDFLWRLRNELHYATGRRDDRLTFDNQRKLAEALGYEDSEHELGVERLMREAYLALSEIARAADALIDRCAVEDAPRPQTLAQSLGLSRGARKTKPVDSAFQLVDGRIAVVEDEVFARRPADLVRIFAVAETYGVRLAAATRDLLVHELARLHERLSEDREAHSELWEVLTREGSDGWALQPLHELGVLGALLPEVARLRARVQHDVYHVYTVDTHTVVALTRLLRLRAGLHADEEPELTRIARAQQRPLALALGLLFHDLGKGLGADHSRRGAELLRAYAARTGLEEQDAQDAEWLVAQHLKMSHVSQRRDLEDRALIDAFARDCGTVERLEMLYVLTYCDMTSVSAENWTAWKAGLLRRLFEKAEAALVGEGLSEPLHAHALEARRERLAAELLRAKGASREHVEQFVHAAPERYLAVHTPESAARHLVLWREATLRGFAAELRRPPSAEAELTLCAPDRKGLLALFSAALAANGIDILSAEVTSLAGGIALDQFHVREPGGGAPAQSRWETARADLLRLLSGEEEPRALVKRRLRRATWAAVAAPGVSTKIRFDNLSSEVFTVLDVFAQDRPGLLHAIAEALHAADASIALARIATEGNKATDAFYLREGRGDLGGKIIDASRLREIEESVTKALAE